MSWNAAAQALLAARDPFAVRWLLWLRPKDRATGAQVGYGISTHDDDATFTVEGEARTYQGMPGNIQMPPIVYRPGARVQTMEVPLVGIGPDTDQILRVYDPKLAPIDIHCALFDGDMNLIDIDRKFRGIVNGSPIETPPVNGISSATLRLVSSARRGTMTMAAKKSHQAQKLRQGDEFRQYGSAGRVASDWWGPRGD